MNKIVTSLEQLANKVDWPLVMAIFLSISVFVAYKEVTLLIQSIK